MRCTKLYAPGTMLGDFFIYICDTGKAFSYSKLPISLLFFFCKGEDHKFTKPVPPPYNPPSQQVDSSYLVVMESAPTDYRRKARIVVFS